MVLVILAVVGILPYIMFIIALNDYKSQIEQALAEKAKGIPKA